MFVAELRNDHKDVTNKIGKNLEVLHSAKLSRNEQSTSRRSGKYTDSILSKDNVITGSRNILNLYPI